MINGRYVDCVIAALTFCIEHRLVGSTKAGVEEGHRIGRRCDEDAELDMSDADAASNWSVIGRRGDRGPDSFGSSLCVARLGDIDDDKFFSADSGY